MRTNLCTMVLAVAALSVVPVTARAESDLAGLLSGLRRNLAPAEANVRDVEMTMRSDDGVVIKWTGRQAYKVLADGPALLTALDSPPEVKGFAVLIREVGGGDPEIWTYVPPVRRVRRVTRTGGEQYFLGSDFTIEDLGFWARKRGNMELYGLGTYRLDPAYEIRETPPAPSAYMRIVTWVHQKDARPLERRFFGPAGHVWRTQHFAEFKQIGKSMFPMAIHVLNHQEGGNSELRILRIDTDSAPADALFDPQRLPQASDTTTW